MRVLVACELSGVVRDAFRAKGHEAYSCDILPAEPESEFHFQGDIFGEKGILDWGWDLLIQHAPCTYSSNSGVRWLHTEPGRWEKMREGAEFFKKLMDAPIPRICGENPIPHKYARKIMGDYSQIIQPWQFGHGETKATCLWLKNLPKLKPTNVVEGREGRIHK